MFPKKSCFSSFQLTHPQPKTMNTPGLSLSRSSLLVRARHRGIKPKVDTNILVWIKAQTAHEMRPHR